MTVEIIRASMAPLVWTDFMGMIASAHLDWKEFTASQVSIELRLFSCFSRI